MFSLDAVAARGSRLTVNPFKATPPLIVDSDVVLTLTLAAQCQCLEPVAGQRGEITKRRSSLQINQKDVAREFLRGDWPHAHHGAT